MMQAGRNGVIYWLDLGVMSGSYVSGIITSWIWSLHVKGGKCPGFQEWKVTILGSGRQVRRPEEKTRPGAGCRTEYIARGACGIKQGSTWFQLE